MGDATAYLGPTLTTAPLCIIWMWAHCVSDAYVEVDALRVERSGAFKLCLNC